MPLDGPAGVADAWLRKSDADFRTIEILLKAVDPPLEIVCFHAQQAAEKALKAVLSFFGIAFPKTHDLSALVARLENRLPLSSGDSDLVELSYLAVAPRYPLEPQEVTLEVARRAIQTANRIRSVSNEVMGESGFERPE